MTTPMAVSIGTGWDGTFNDEFRDQLSNDPIAWSTVAHFLDHSAYVVTNNVLPNVEGAVRAAEEVSANLFCAYAAAKQHNIDLGFRRSIEQAPGNSFGAKLINWLIDKINYTTMTKAKDIRFAWSSFHQQMASAIEMMVRHLLEGDPAVRGLVSTPEQVLAWITEHGGLGELHREYMNFRRTESQQDKARKAATVLRAAEENRKREATEAGFSSWSAYQADRNETAERRKEEILREKFDVIKQRLVNAGRAVTCMPPSGRLVIVSENQLYVLSEKDEYSLLRCAATALI